MCVRTDTNECVKMKKILGGNPYGGRRIPRNYTGAQKASQRAAAVVKKHGMRSLPSI